MFLSVGFWMLDIPHLFANCMRRCCNSKEPATKPDEQEIGDDFPYELGWHMSYGLSTFAIALMFATLVPYVPVFAVVFFMFKYYVDKYNLSFVYNPEFISTGVIRKRVIPISIFLVILVQLVNVGFFAGKLGRKYLWIGAGVIGTEVFILIAIYTFKWSKLAKSYRH